jgi:MFS family permease
MPQSRLSQSAVPRGIWALGCVSLLMDISSEMTHSLLPVFLVSTLGASAATIGIIEGIAEATASIGKVFSGALSDHIGRRKLLVVIGYGMAALTKPLFPLATSSAWVLLARFLDRIGKGIRDAPRDALIADISPRDRRGASYGLRQALDTIGALAGPLIAIALMILSSDDYRLVFWIAVGPAVAAVAVLVVAVREPAHAHTATRPSLDRSGIRELDSPYWWAVATFGAFTLARYSEAFLVLKAADVGLSVALVPLVYVVLSGVYAVVAFPAGQLSDRIGRRRLLFSGVVALLAADVVLALAGSVTAAFIGIALWGLHMALTQGIFAALIADLAPERLRGTAFGILNFAGGGAGLLASVIAGALWTLAGPAATFAVSAVFAVAAGVLSIRRLETPAS